MQIEKAQRYLSDWASAGGTDDPSLKEAIETVCGTQEAPTFVLTSADRLAPMAIRAWTNALGAVVGPNANKLKSAQDIVQRMVRYQRKNGSRIPGEPA